MKFDNFSVVAIPVLRDASCKNCKTELVEVSNGWFSSAMFCPKCENVYIVKLVKAPDKQVNSAFLENARRESAKKMRKEMQ